MWHPLLAAAETEPAVWTLTDEYGHDYATIRLTRGTGGLRYVATTTQTVGEYQSLRQAVEAAHHAWVRAHAPGGAPNGGKGYVLGT